jgi:2-C-methyl-D-erythritol 2,4-cyclodiphosphate synthase
MRIGHGYDVHRLEAGRTLVLGGEIVSTEFGAVAHSDGDVLLHAICDALLGAAALGDIGRHFPDTSAEFRNISSLLLLERTCALLADQGLRVGNIDATLILERPKIAPFVGKMTENIARTAGISTGAVSIKATTSEGLGFVGEGRGVVAHAVALLIPF